MVDNSFLKRDPFTLLSSGRFTTNDFMVGFNQDGIAYDVMRGRGPPGLLDDFKPENFRVALNLVVSFGGQYWYSLYSFEIRRDVTSGVYCVFQARYYATLA